MCRIKDECARKYQRRQERQKGEKEQTKDFDSSRQES